MLTKHNSHNKSKKKDMGMWVIYGVLVGTIASIIFGNLQAKWDLEFALELWSAQSQTGEIVTTIQNKADSTSVMKTYPSDQV